MFDSDDILSSVAHRLDQYVKSGKFHVTEQAQLWGLLSSIADHVVADKGRTIHRWREAERREHSSEREASPRPADEDRIKNLAADEIDIRRCMRALNSPDRRLLSLWLAGESFRLIAKHTSSTARKVGIRFKAIMLRLRKDFPRP